MSRRRRGVIVTGLLAILMICGWQGGGYSIAHFWLSKDFKQIDKALSPDEFDPEKPFDAERQRVLIPIKGYPGANLEAWLFPADSNSDRYQDGAVVIMTHGFDSSKKKKWDSEEGDGPSSLFDQGSRELVQAGFHVLMIDFRNHGGSDQVDLVSLGLRESDDVIAAAEYAANDLSRFSNIEVDPDRIGVRSPSMGAVATILACAKNEGKACICAAWCEAPFATAKMAVSDFLAKNGVPGLFVPPAKTWMQQISGIQLDAVRPVDAVKFTACPLMIVHSKGDLLIPYRHFELYEQARDAKDNANPAFETKSYPKGRHHRLWQGSADYLKDQTEFFLKHLGKSEP